MKPLEHLLAAGAASLLLIPVLGRDSVTFVAASVLVDGDHYLDYLWRNGFKDFSLKRTVTFHELLFDNLKRDGSLGLNLGHTAEFLLLLGGAAWITGQGWLWAAWLGVLFHLGLDLAYLYRRGGVFRRALSIVEYLIRWNWLQAHGRGPHRAYRVTLEAMLPRPGQGKKAEEGATRVSPHQPGDGPSSPG